MLVFFDLFLFILQQFNSQICFDFVLICLTFACINLVLKGLRF